ncbi:hypothetical protein ALC60_09424 [Trachymyrmex zeteki]|uniref:Uncharacterized protein n=1 Tax=Mycetomoellerius zeteki TaxID=64791 RepID=A0A151WUE4_9HYME|nr:hypothetical protein ALC60_09424 [Trachymyrmex zeteki]
MSDLRKSPNPLTAEDILILEDLILILNPLELATKDISGSQYVTMSLIIPLINDTFHQNYTLSKRQLKTRLHEHVSNINKKVITSHRIDQNHNFDWDNVEILDREAFFNKRLISKMVHIKRQTHGLNK